jgi:hypothetical protein
MTEHRLVTTRTLLSIIIAAVAAFGYAKADAVDCNKDPNFSIPDSWDNEQLEEFAQHEAQIIYGKHDDPTKIKVDRVVFHDMGLALALHHGLLGKRADWFAMEFEDAYEALVVGY